MSDLTASAIERIAFDRVKFADYIHSLGATNEEAIRSQLIVTLDPLYRSDYLENDVLASSYSEDMPDIDDGAAQYFLEIGNVNRDPDEQAKALHASAMELIIPDEYNLRVEQATVRRKWAGRLFGVAGVTPMVISILPQLPNGFSKAAWAGFIGTGSYYLATALQQARVTGYKNEALEQAERDHSALLPKEVIAIDMRELELAE